MADPCARPLKFYPENEVYCECYNLYGVMQELMKELIIWKPKDPLLYIKDEIRRIAKGLYSPQIFILGTKRDTESLIHTIAEHTGIKSLTLDEIIKSAPQQLGDPLSLFLDPVADIDAGDPLRNLLVSTILRRISMDDCLEKGYIIFGFPQSKAQAICAQTAGLLPRQVFIVYPPAPPTPSKEAKEVKGKDIDKEDDDKCGVYCDEIFYSKQEKDIVLLQSQISYTSMRKYEDYFNLREIAACYDSSICKTLSFLRRKSTKPEDLREEFLNYLLTEKPNFGPFIPRILLIGSSGSGKSRLATYLAHRFNLIKINWLDLIRGGTLWRDAISEDCRNYIEKLVPLSEAAVKTLLDRRLRQDDCQKKGWVLHGFPSSMEDAKVMFDNSWDPNRVFFLSTPEDLCKINIMKKRDEIKKRIIHDDGCECEHPGHSHPAGINLGALDVQIEVGNAKDAAKHPFSDFAIEYRLKHFRKNIDKILTFYGKTIVFVDGSKHPHVVRDFVETAVKFQPNIRF